VLTSVKGEENLQPSPPFIGDEEREGRGGFPESVMDAGVGPESVTSGTPISPGPRSLTGGHGQDFECGTSLIHYRVALFQTQPTNKQFLHFPN
jgi:hypothetical protein